MAMHPIVSACGTATYNKTAKFITKILQKYCGKTSSFIKDSADFIQKIKHLSINPIEETLVSFDVSTLNSVYNEKNMWRFCFIISAFLLRAMYL